MSEYSFTYKTDGFSLAKAHDSTLYIKACKAEFSILIVEEGRVLAWKAKCALADLAEDEDLGDILTAPFKKIVVGITPDALTLVPTALFAEENTLDYARFLDVKTEDRVFASQLDTENQVICKIDHNITDALASRFSLTDTVPAYRGWLAAIAKSGPGNHHIYIDINCGQLTLANFNEGKLRFYNSFVVTDVNDILYYSLFAVEQLQLQADYTSLIVSGNCPASDFDQLNQFFKVVKYNDLKIVDVPMGVPAHQILALASLA
jgi:hypothetical protein